MSEDQQNKDKAADDKADLIGVDPLAWLSEEEKSALEDAATTNVKTDSATSTTSDVGNAGVIKLQSSLTISDINELVEQLNNIDKEQAELVLDAADVERIDTAALQLLVGYFLLAINDGKKVNWKDPSDKLVNSAKLLGLTETMQLAA